jgi:hypothetical protein
MAKKHITEAQFGAEFHELEQERLVAVSEYDDACVADDDGAAAKLAKERLETIEHRIRVLRRKREISAEEEARQAIEKAAADRLEAISATKKSAAATKRAAQEVRKAIDELVDKFRTFDERYGDTASRLKSLNLSPARARLVHDGIQNRMEGALIMGLLRKADMPALDRFDPITAMRAFDGKHFDELIDSRLDYLIRSAAMDAPELRGRD